MKSERARDLPAGNSDASPGPDPTLWEGWGGEFASVLPPAGGAQDKRKRQPHPGVERNDQNVEVDVEALTGRRGEPRLLGESRPAGSPGQRTTVNGAERKTAEVGGGGGGGGDGAAELPLEERLARLEAGVTLWGNTYVPPIAPDEKQRLIDRWSAEEGSTNGTAPARLPVGGESVNRRIEIEEPGWSCRSWRARTRKTTSSCGWTCLPTCFSSCLLGKTDALSCQR